MEWVLKNDAPAHKLIAYYDKLELTELKDAACLPPSTPTALIRAPKPVGLGHKERADKIGVAMNQRLVKCWNSAKKLERDTCRDSVEFFRQANVISLLGPGEKLQMHAAGVEVVTTRDWPVEFCGWDVRKMTWATVMKLPVIGWPIMALAQCLRTGISVVTAPGDRIGVKDMCADEEVTMNPAVISDRMHTITDDLWVDGLKTCSRKYPTKDLDRSQRKYMVTWFNNKDIIEAAVKTLIKAYAMALPTSVNVKIWSSNGTGLCVCGRPGTQSHVLGGWCPTVRAMAVLRHNEIVQKLVDSTMTKGAAAWSMVGQPDVLPPDSLFASKNWRDDVPAVECDDGYGNVTLVKHYKPDAVLAEMQSPLRKVIALVDAQAIGTDEFGRAAQTKADRYSPLADMMRSHLGPLSRIDVIPVIIGACGVPPPDWCGVCARLRVKISPMKLWKQVQQIVIEHMHKIFWAWYNHQHFNGSKN